MSEFSDQLFIDEFTLADKFGVYRGAYRIFGIGRLQSDLDVEVFPN